VGPGPPGPLDKSSLSVTHCPKIRLNGFCPLISLTGALKDVTNHCFYCRSR